MAIFRTRPARIIEVAVFASECATLSQRWKGTIGALMASARKIPSQMYELYSGVIIVSRFM